METLENLEVFLEITVWCSVFEIRTVVEQKSIYKNTAQDTKYVFCAVWKEILSYKAVILR